MLQKVNLVFDNNSLDGKKKQTLDMAILKYNKIKLTTNQTKETRMIPF